MELSNSSITTSMYINKDDILRHLSNERARQLLPVFLVLAIVFVFGVIGNALTIYIYWFKFKATRSRAAIMTLAAFDLITCLVAVPGEAVDLRFSFNYGSDVMCRVLRACATFPNIASGIMLTAVAVDRYRLICSPLKSSSAVTKKTIKRQVAVVCTLSLLIAWPAAVVYGIMTSNTGIDGVVGQECSTSDTVRHTKIPLAYNAFLGLVFLTAFTVIIVCYSLVARQVYRQGAFRKTFLRSHSRELNLTARRSELEPSSYVTSQDPSEAGRREAPHSPSRPVSPAGHSQEDATGAESCDQRATVCNDLPSSYFGDEPSCAPELQPDLVLSSSASGEPRLDILLPVERKPEGDKKLGRVVPTSSEVESACLNSKTADQEALDVSEKCSFEIQKSESSISLANEESRLSSDIQENDKDIFLLQNDKADLKYVEGGNKPDRNNVTSQPDTPPEYTEISTCNGASQSKGTLPCDEDERQTARVGRQPLRTRPSLPRLAVNGRQLDPAVLSVLSLSPLPSSPASCELDEGVFRAKRQLRRTLSLRQRLSRKKSSNVGSATSSNGGWRTGKTTLMLGLISLVFVLSYVPHLVARVKRAVDKEWLRESDVTSGALVAYSLCVRSYFLNSVANVFVYGVCSKKFRQECGKVMAALCRCRR